VTDDSTFKKQVRDRMAETGEKYTVARRMVIAGRDPGRSQVALRVYLILPACLSGHRSMINGNAHW
jgi:hypothetical protein